MSRLTFVLIALVAVTLVALYAVTGRPPRESFENSSGSDDDTVEGLVFKAYVDVFGVPPSPHHTSFYSNVVKNEKLDEEALRLRIRKDGKEVVEGLTTTTTSSTDDTSGVAKANTDASQNKAAVRSPANTTGLASGTGNTTAPTAPDSKQEASDDADLQALREKALSIAKMSAPVSGDNGSAQLSSKLRNIAGQVSALARQYDVDLSGASESPKGIESFISFR